MNYNNTGTAAVIMDVVPLVMSRIRSEIRISRMSGLSIIQFRTLIYLYRHDNVSLSELAEHLGLKLPSTSKLIDSLVDRKLVRRRESIADRRRVSLQLSPPGFDEMAKTQKSAGNRIAALLDNLTQEQRSGIVKSLNSLKTVFQATNRTGG